MPEPVELRVRGCERRRVAVAEPDDGDPPQRDRGSGGPSASTSHAPSPRRTSRPAARTSGSSACVGDGAHATTAVVADLGADAELRRASSPRGASGRFRPRTRRRRAAGPPRRAPITGTTDAVDEQTPGTSVTKRIRSASSPTASAAAASSAFTFSGPRASGATTGIRPSSSAARSTAGADGSGSPTQPELRDLLRAQADLVADQRRPRAVADRRAQRGVDLGEATRARPRARRGS